MRKGKKASEVEMTEVKQLVEKTTTQKEYHSISENIKQQKEATGNGQKNEIGEKPK